MSSAKRVAGLLAVGVIVSVALVAWLGYRAVQEWQRSSALLASRRSERAADVLTSALTHDMEGVQHSILLSAVWNQRMIDPPYSIVSLASSAFARYPYPESFFGWHSTGAALPVFFNRRDRLPKWALGAAEGNRFPVVVVRHPAIAEALLRRIRLDAAQYRQFSIFEIQLDGIPYQVVARLSYRDELRQELDAIFGFMVNLRWARDSYFQGLTDEVIRVDSSTAGIPLTINDDKGDTVVSRAGGMRNGAVARRTFSLSFFDPLLVASAPSPDLPRRLWAVQVYAADDSQYGAAVRAADYALILGALAAALLALGLHLTVRSVRVNAELAELRNDFVSSVTHELKTPIATIKAAGETLRAGRVVDGVGQREYAQLIVQETKRLSRLVDNLLAFSRVTDATSALSFEPLMLDELVREAVHRFSPQVNDGSFETVVSIPEDLPLVSADRTAMVLLLDNLIDNAIRYSVTKRRLEISARLQQNEIALDVRDYGRGIPEDELPHVTRKFFRGRNAGSAGTGLGLAIVRNIVVDHGGRLMIQSTVGVGTTVRVTLRAVGREDATAPPAVPSPSRSYGVPRNGVL